MNRPEQRAGRDRKPGEPGSISTGLIERLQVCDEAAWQRLLDLYGPLVFSWCRRCDVPPQDTPDVVQDVFQAVSHGIATFRRTEDHGTFRGWLRTITQSKIHDYFRRRTGRPVAMGGTDAQRYFANVAAEDWSDSGQSGPLACLARRALETIRDEFEGATWRAFWLTAIQQQASRDVAQQLGTTSGAVRQAKYKVLRRLRQELGDAD